MERRRSPSRLGTLLHFPSARENADFRAEPRACVSCYCSSSWISIYNNFQRLLFLLLSFINPSSTISFFFSSSLPRYLLNKYVYRCKLIFDRLYRIRRTISSVIILRFVIPLLSNSDLGNTVKRKKDFNYKFN